MTVAVIGAGAAGLMAAGAAAEAGARVLLFDKNAKAGRKIMITGKGRCNVTNNCDVQTVLANVPVNPRFLYSALGRYSPADTMAFFEAHGVPLKTERGGRVFPQSDKATDICGALKQRLHRLNVDILHERAEHIQTRDGYVYAVRTNAGIREFDAVILATGGASYPLTGSTGDGYKMATELGHTIITPKPSLVPVEVAEKWVSELMGLTLKNVLLTVCEEQSAREVFSEQGELLFTHFGLSGPLVLSASSHMKGLPTKRYLMQIDLKPALDYQTLDHRLQSDFAKYQNRDFVNALGDLLPVKLIPAVIRQSGIDSRKKVNVITREERHKLLDTLKGFTLTAARFRPIDEAIITSGGVKTSEISPKTLESKLIRGLYFAGEVIDVDAYTGGFNLQIAFSTAHLAATNAAVE